MENDKAKAQQFLNRLMQNPSLNGFSALQREDQLLQFFIINEDKLKPTLSSPAYFNGWSWTDIYQIMTDTLYDITNREILPQLESEIFDRTNYAYVNFMKYPPLTKDVKKQLYEALRKLLTVPAGRQSLAGTLTALRSGILKRYVMLGYERQKYIHFEITKVQRLRMPLEEIYHLMKTTMFINSLAILYTPEGVSKQRGNQNLSPAYAEKITKRLGKQIPGLPEPIIRGGINGQLPFQDNPKLETTARISSIFSSRCSQMKEGMTIDRGAAASDQSWFNVARRNYKYYGYDFDMLTEFYNISAENGW
ncbi:hypothetical protein EXM22_08685 [Oceanispirochaeta crateris]|uniref:Uncharacterized protein n=1 Tax=Oceanispirochaeta crateris TaxID=2518645 RepID=A0A5C1QKQ6_9SPIO|nr:hypothetical protein [Oceanispirochaeta crateris]QEN08057.1 hypothetical protein EXM22_08685 [Oceanispirochaeta crateris]